jgi:hypothetical protein
VVTGKWRSAGKLSLRQRQVTANASVPSLLPPGATVAPDRTVPVGSPPDAPFTVTAPPSEPLTAFRHRSPALLPKAASVAAPASELPAPVSGCGLAPRGHCSASRRPFINHQRCIALIIAAARCSTVCHQPVCGSCPIKHPESVGSAALFDTVSARNRAVSGCRKVELVEREVPLLLPGRRRYVLVARHCSSASVPAVMVVLAPV